MLIYLRRKEHNWMEKSEKYIFLGYSDVIKAYTFLDVKNNKLVISRDAIFDEKPTSKDKKIKNIAIISSN